MSRVLYLLGVPICWIMVGVIADAHKGAVAAGAWGLICLAFIAAGALLTAATRSRSNFYFDDALATILVFLTIPTVLINWGNGTAHGAAWAWTILWFFGATVAVKLIGWASRKIEEHWGT